MTIDLKESILVANKNNESNVKQLIKKIPKDTALPPILNESFIVFETYRKNKVPSKREINLIKYTL